MHPSREAFDQFYSQTSMHVFSYCSQMLHDPDAAEEAMQQTYAYLWEVLHSGGILADVPTRARRGNDDSTVRRPLNRIVIHGSMAEVKLLRIADLHIDRLRKRFVMDMRRYVDLDHALEIPDDRMNVSEIIERKDIAKHVVALLAKLPSDCRRTMILHFFDDRTQSEIAAILHLDRTTVTKRIHRGKSMLRKLLPPSLKEEIRNSGL
jgi:DNA-directed RNA polymerase specialized sigma24 family protein